MIDLRRLRHFSALVQHGNFHRAADALHLTQPALTRSIQALEAHVGAPLLTRHRTGVEPTELGRLLLRRLEKPYLLARRMVILLQSVGGGTLKD